MEKPDDITDTQRLDRLLEIMKHTSCADDYPKTREEIDAEIRNDVPVRPGPLLPVSKYFMIGSDLYVDRQELARALRDRDPSIKACTVDSSGNITGDRVVPISSLRLKGVDVRVSFDGVPIRGFSDDGTFSSEPD